MATVGIFPLFLDLTYVAVAFVVESRDSRHYCRSALPWYLGLRPGPATGLYQLFSGSYYPVLSAGLTVGIAGQSLRRSSVTLNIG